VETIPTIKWAKTCLDGLGMVWGGGEACGVDIGGEGDVMVLCGV